MIFEDFKAKETVINEYYCRGRQNNCNMIYLIQNLFSLGRQNVREKYNLFITLKTIINHYLLRARKFQLNPQHDL